MLSTTHTTFAWSPPKRRLTVTPAITPSASPIRILLCSARPFGLSGVSSSRSVAISRSNASRSTRFGSLLSDIFFVLAVSVLTTPAQLVAQNVEVVSIHWLNEIECRAALSNHDSIGNFQRKPDLPIERQCYLFLVRL